MVPQPNRFDSAEEGNPICNLFEVNSRWSLSGEATDQQIQPPCPSVLDHCYENEPPKSLHILYIVQYFNLSDRPMDLWLAAVVVWYVDNRSLGLDLKILLISVLQVLLGQGISLKGWSTMPRFTGNRKLPETD